MLYLVKKKEKENQKKGGLSRLAYWCGQRMRQCSGETMATAADDGCHRAEKAGEIRKNPRTESTGEGQGGGGGQKEDRDVPCCRVGQQAVVTGSLFRVSDVRVQFRLTPAYK